MKYIFKNKINLLEDLNLPNYANIDLLLDACKLYKIQLNDLIKDIDNCIESLNNNNIKSQGNIVLKSIENVDNLYVLKKNIKNYLDLIDPKRDFSNFNARVIGEKAKNIRELIRLCSELSHQTKGIRSENERYILVDAVKKLIKIVNEVGTNNYQGVSVSTLRKLKDDAKLLLDKINDKNIETGISAATKELKNLFNDINKSLIKLDKQGVRTSTFTGYLLNIYKKVPAISKGAVGENDWPKSIYNKNAYKPYFITNVAVVADVVDGIENNINNVLNTNIFNIIEELKHFKVDLQETTVTNDEPTIKDDWAEKLKQATKSENPVEEIAEIWDKYFESEWGKNAEKVRQLGEAFRQELNYLGFSGLNNPFIIYLENNLDELAIDSHNYAAIHNAFVNKYINSKDLKGEGKLKNNNLIFNKYLYSKYPTDIVSYLRLQAAILDKYSTDNISKYFIDRKLVMVYEKKPADFIYAIFAQGVSPQKLDTLADSATNETMQDTRLKSLEAVNAALAVCFGSDGLKVRWDKSIAKEIVHLLRTKEKIIDAVKYIALINNIPTENIKRYKIIAKNIAENGINVSLKTQNELKKLLAPYDINTDPFQTIAEILSVANLDEMV